MQVYPNRLAQELNQQLKPFYLIFGDEPQQKITAMDMVVSHAKSLGFDERTVLVADKDFKWSELYEATQSMSLFSARQIIQLELPTGKPGKEGSAALLDVVAQANPDTLLLLHGPRIGKDVQRAKWFREIDKTASYVPCYPLEGNQLNKWIVQTAKNAACSLSPNAVALLAEYCEGNMLAGAQEIQKLALVYPDQVIDEKAIEAAVVNQSRYNVFQLVDVLLAGDTKKTTQMLLALEAEGVEPVIILWALVREWQTLNQLMHSSGQINWQAHRIWGQRQQFYQAALTRLNKKNIDDIGALLSRADTVFKQQTVTRPYVALCHLCLVFITPQMLSMAWCD